MIGFLFILPQVEKENVILDDTRTSKLILRPKAKLASTVLYIRCSHVEPSPQMAVMFRKVVNF